MKTRFLPLVLGIALAAPVFAHESGDHGELPTDISGVLPEHQELIREWYEHSEACSEQNQAACKKRDILDAKFEELKLCFFAEVPAFYHKGEGCDGELTMGPVIYNDAALRGAFMFFQPADRKFIQRKLASSGHYQGSIDGAFGPATSRAIQARLAQIKEQNPGVAYTFETRERSLQAIQLILMY